MPYCWKCVRTKVPDEARQCIEPQCPAREAQRRDEERQRDEEADAAFIGAIGAPFPPRGER